MMKLEQKNLYPLLFKPIYKSVMWGGNMLNSYLHRELPETQQPIGEAWEIADRDDNVSIVENGPLSGKSLRALIENYGYDLVGRKYSDKRFPLLIKIIDAGSRLSLQVHPDEDACKKIGNNAEPKTEMWYIMAAEKDAKIFAGLNHRATKSRFLDTYSSSEVENYLQVNKSFPGDAYFITAGTVHSIGEGNLLLEIQQNSDTTYRISDWGRVDANGKSRPLHIENALKSIHFVQRTSPKISGVVSIADHNRKFPIIQYCPYFKVDDLKITTRWDDNTSGTFNVITAITHDIKVGKSDNLVEVKAGRSCLIPSALGDYSIFVDESTETTVIRTQV